MLIDVHLVRRLIQGQFPEWGHLSIDQVEPGGWDNRTFRLGTDFTIRLPSAISYEVQVAKEQRWLPRLAPYLPAAIPIPIAMGMPSEEYPWHWSIYRWLPGEPASVARISDYNAFAVRLADFLIALHRIDPEGGPAPGPHNFYRGGDVGIYDDETRRAIAHLGEQVNSVAAMAVWDAALNAPRDQRSVWVHGDVHATNLLVQEGRLSAVIDFGCLGVGDPACDMAIAWTFLRGQSRDAFRVRLAVDESTWARSRGWAIWKALITLAEPTYADSVYEGARRVINEVVADFQGR